MYRMVLFFMISLGDFLMTIYTDHAGDNGNYWSSTPYESDSDARLAYSLYFLSSYHYLSWGYRNNGRSVRPVSD